jgi:KDO2-lipid IV(A) lauroyltransferase
MQKLERPVNLVMATEANRTVERFNTNHRERHGLRVIHSDSSIFASVEMIRALRRGEIVAIQLDRAAPGHVTRAIPFFGKPAEFQVGPFALARAADVPLWPVFVARLGRLRYHFLPEPTRLLRRGSSDEELLAVMQDVVRSFEGHVRAYPHQWFQFHRVWAT